MIMTEKKKCQYEKDREFTSPFDCGFSKNEMSLNEMRALTAGLTEEEKSSPYAAIFYERPDEKTAEQKAAYAAPLEEARMYMPAESGRIMIEQIEGYPDMGYGVMENGVGYAAIRVDQTDVNDDMIREYREYYAHDEKNRDIFYKTWYPGMHVRHFDDAVIENFGYGAMLLDMDRELYGLKHAGITKEYIDEKDPGALNFLLIGGGGFMLWAPQIQQQSLMIQYTREHEKGRTLQIRFWIGIKPGEDGACIPVPAGTKEEIEIKMRCQFNHCVTEYARELKHMKEFWNKNHPDLKVEI